MTTTANDLLMSGGVSAAKFPTMGANVTGRIVREPEAREQTDFTTGAVLRWDNGDARMQIIVHLATDQRDPSDATDDGTRALYIKGQMLNAVRAAIRAVGAAGLTTGGHLTVTYVGDAEPTKRGFNGAKQYTATYVAPSASAVANVLAAGDAPQQVANHAPPPPATGGADAYLAAQQQAAAALAAAQAAAQSAPAGPPPNGVDPAIWNTLDATQRASVLAAANNVKV